MREETVDAAAFRAICGSCHPTAMVEDFRTEPEWREELDQMIKIGARGTEEQFDRVMRHLRRNWTKVNINTAEARDIAPVLDVNAETAQAVVRYRTQNGPFRTLDELSKVPGLDPSKLQKWKSRVAFF